MTCKCHFFGDCSNKVDNRNPALHNTSPNVDEEAIQEALEKAFPKKEEKSDFVREMDRISKMRENGAILPKKLSHAHLSHAHCWNQNYPIQSHPAKTVCGILPEKHEQCCLCDLKPLPEKGRDKMVEPSYTDSVLEEFRERAAAIDNDPTSRSWREWFEKFLREKLEIMHFLREKHKMEWLELGKKQGRELRTQEIAEIIKDQKQRTLYPNPALKETSPLTPTGEAINATLTDLLGRIGES